MNQPAHSRVDPTATHAPKSITKKRLKEDAQTVSLLIENGKMEEAAAFGATNPHVFAERMCQTSSKLRLYVGEPFLNMAAERRSMACVEAFVAAGAPLEGRGSQGRTPLLAALKHNHVFTGGEDNDRIVLALLDAGARADAMDDTGESPIYQCCGDLDRKITARLIEGGANLNTWSIEHDLPSISLLASRCASSRLKTRRDSLMQIIDAGADLNLRARRIDQLPLAQALCSNDIDLADAMVAHGADWRRCSQDGRSLMFAAMTAEAVQWVLDKNPGLRDATDHRGITPLQHMVDVAMTPDSSFRDTVNGAIMAITLAGADPTAIDHEGPLLARTAADRVSQGNNVALKNSWRSLLAGIEASRALDEINAEPASPPTP